MPAKILHEERINNDPEISRLLTAAVINRKFQQQLLANPSAAIRNGFNGEKFHFTPQVRSLITSIRAESLSDFASQMILAKTQPRYPIATPYKSFSQVAVSPGLD